MNHKIKLLPAAAFILAGGKSRRFGSPKWNAMLGGITLIEHSWNLCDDLFKSTVIVSKSKYDFGEKRIIQDIINVQAPLTGIYTALKQSEHRWNFIISCDLPLITKKIILKLWEKSSKKCDGVLPVTGRGLEPTCGFYTTTALPIGEQMIAKGDYSLHNLNKQLNCEEVDFTQNTDLFLNVNSEDDLVKAEEHYYNTKR